MKESINVFGEPLIECSSSPLTGFFRNGCCDTADDDVGSHTVCISSPRNFLNIAPPLATTYQHQSQQLVLLV